MPATRGEYEHQTAKALELATRDVNLMIFPGVTPLENMVATFDGARKCVTLCCHDLTSEAIAFAVIRAHRRAGVQVCVLADARCAAKRASHVKKLQEANVPVKLTDGVQYTFCLIDDDIILSGSADWTSEVEHKVMNMVASVSGVGGKMPDAFAHILDEHWPTSASTARRAAAAAGPGPTSAANKNNNNKRKETDSAEPAGEIAAVSLNVLVDSINRAKKVINFTCGSVTSKEVAIALINAAKRPGVDVTGTVNTILSRVKVSHIPRMQEHGIDVRLSDDQQKELFIIDSSIMMPASDWSGSIEELSRNMRMSPPLSFPGEPSTPSQLGGSCDESSLVPMISVIDSAQRSVMVGSRTLTNQAVADAIIRASRRLGGDVTVLVGPESVNATGSQVRRLMAARVTVSPVAMVLPTHCIIDGVVTLDGTTDWVSLADDAKKIKGDASIEKLLTHFRNAKESINIRCREFTNERLADGLIAAKARPGMEVRMIVDLEQSDPNSPLLARLMRGNVEIRHMAPRAGDHEETFCIIDSDLLIKSTADWTARSDEQWGSIGLNFADNNAP